VAEQLAAAEGSGDSEGSLVALALLLAGRDHSAEKLSQLALPLPFTWLWGRGEVTPWTLRALPAAGDFHGPLPALETAAERALAAARQLDPPPPPPAAADPLSPSRQEPDEAVQARRAEAGRLRRFAGALLVRAGLGWARVGARDRAVRLLARAKPLLPPQADSDAVAVVRLAAGDATGAAEELGGLVSSSGFDLQEHRRQRSVLLSQAFALAALGRFDTALRAATRADDLAGPDFLEGRSVAGIWLRAALALRSQAASPAIPGLQEAPEAIGEHIKALDLESLRWWWRLATGGAVSQPADRLLAPSHREVPMAVLPAMMYVVGRAVGNDGDVEVWLDRIFGRQHLSGDPRVMLARAEAARWRGDNEAAQRWERRASTLYGLINSSQDGSPYRQAVLLAGTIRTPEKREAP